jgi:glycosyltransferase involved in cell wall biosynthesis
MKIVNVCLGIWAVGGAERGYQRIADKLPEYKWLFTTKVDPTANLVIYSNTHEFYKQAKRIGVPAILRVTGPRSYSIPQPDDLGAVVCSSKKSYEISRHKNKYLIYNGIDFSMIDKIKLTKCDLLYGCARIGLGQQVEKAIKYAIKNNRHLTVTGAKQHVTENVYDTLRKKYPQVRWTGLLDEETMLSYVKGCKEGIMPTSVHGLSNFIIELAACGKPLINLGGVETVNKEDIDINVTARKYKELIEEHSK